MEFHNSSQTEDSRGPLSAASTIVSSRSTSPGVQAPAQQPRSWENEALFQRLAGRDPCFLKAAAARERGDPRVQVNDLGLLEGFMEALFKVLADVQVLSAPSACTAPAQCVFVSF